MRCPDCNKFVSYDEPQAEDVEVSLAGKAVSVDATVRLNCQDCGTTLKESTFNVEKEFEHECKPDAERENTWKPDEDFKEGDEVFEIEAEGDAEGTSRLQTTDSKGKPIKSSRYMKQFYGFSIEPEIKCRKCGETFSVSLTDESQASSFDECC